MSRTRGNDDLIAWVWTCTRCDDAFDYQPRDSEEDGWPVVREWGVLHLRNRHGVLHAEREFDESEWTQGGEPQGEIDESADLSSVESEPDAEWDIDEAVRLLIGGETYAETARRYGLKPATLAWRVQGLVPKRPPGTKPKPVPAHVRQRAIRLLREGTPMRHVEQDTGMSWRQVQRLNAEVNGRGPGRGRRAAR